MDQRIVILDEEPPRRRTPGWPARAWLIRVGLLLLAGLTIKLAVDAMHRVSRMATTTLGVSVGWWLGAGLLFLAGGLVFGIAVNWPSRPVRVDVRRGLLTVAPLALGIYPLLVLTGNARIPASLIWVLSPMVTAVAWFAAGVAVAGAIRTQDRPLVVVQEGPGGFVARRLSTGQAASGASESEAFNRLMGGGESLGRGEERGG